jgi:hypothetical protein
MINYDKFEWLWKKETVNTSEIDYKQGVVIRTKDEFRFILNLTSEMNLDPVLEIGIGTGPTGGKAERFYRELCGVTEYVGVDWRNEKAQVCGDSHNPETISEIKKLLPHGCGLLFIDGDHTYEGAKADFINYSPLVKEGGVIALHDIRNFVFEFWKEIRMQYPRKAVSYNTGILFT